MRYTVSEAARILGIPRRRIYLHVRAGKILSERREVDGVMVIGGAEILRYWRRYN